MINRDIELEVVSRLLQEGAQQIERHKGRLAHLERSRDNTTGSRVILKKLEEAQVRLKAQREEIERRGARHK
jgi:hypothetical protein